MNTSMTRQRGVHQGASAYLSAGFSLIFLSLSACNSTEEERAALEYALSSPQFETPQVPAPLVGPSCFSERFVQPHAIITKKVDLLFLADSSASLDEERSEIAEGIDSLIEQLPADVDLRIGVMFAHGSTSKYTGRLYKKGSNTPYVLDSTALERNKIRDLLYRNLTQIVSDNQSDGGESGLYSLSRMLDSDRLKEAQDLGFLRDDAALAVITISDENDICATFPSGVTPVPDPEGSELKSFQRDCAGISPKSVYAKLKALKGNLPLLVSGVHYNTDTYPRSGENEYGYGWIDLIKLSNGVTVDMAGSHYNEGLADIGRLTTVKLNLITDFTLARPNVDIATLKTWVDGVPVPAIYFQSTNSIHLEEAGTALSVVDIYYCLKPGSNPNNDDDDDNGDDDGGNQDGGDGGDDGGTIIGV